MVPPSIKDGAPSIKDCAPSIKDRAPLITGGGLNPGYNLYSPYTLYLLSLSLYIYIYSSSIYPVDICLYILSRIYILFVFNSLRFHAIPWRSCQETPYIYIYIHILIHIQIHMHIHLHIHTHGSLFFI